MKTRANILIIFNIKLFFAGCQMFGFFEREAVTQQCTEVCYRKKHTYNHTRVVMLEHNASLVPNSTILKC